MINTYINQTLERFRPYKGGTWCYEDGILMHALLTLYQKTNDKTYFDFVQEYYDEMINAEGKIKNYSQSEYNIDNIAPGIALFYLYDKTKNEKYRLAILEYEQQTSSYQRRNFWHKSHPKVWLDEFI